MSLAARDSHAWTMIIPLKHPAAAKSRLVGPDPTERRALARAFALDTVAAALSARRVTRVVVVTGDRDTTDLEDAGALVLRERTTGLNLAVSQAATVVRSRWPLSPMAAVAGDLASARSEDFDAALSAGPVDSWFVADAARVGTTMLATSGATRLAPHFGPGSRAAHLRSGAIELTRPDLPRLRRDIDTVEDLHAALELGVGHHTRAALRQTEGWRLA